MIDKKRLKEHLNNGKIEYVMCASNWIDDGIDYLYKPYNIDKGICYNSIRHPCIYEQTNKIYPAEKYGMLTVEGFLTTKNRFLNREEALELVKSNDQLKQDLIGSVLTSEDLW